MIAATSIAFAPPSPLPPVLTGASRPCLKSNKPRRRARRRSSGVQAVPRGALEVPSLAEAAARIRAANFSDGAVIVRGALQPVNWVERLAIPRNLDIRDIRVELDVDGLTARLPGDVVPLLPQRTRDALCTLAVAHAAACENTKPTKVVRGRVAQVKGVPCRRFHVDKVNLRTLATLVGPGCVVAPRSSVDMNSLFSSRAKDPNLSNEEHDKYVLVEGSSAVKELACGDVAFLPGSGSDDADIEVAAVHRSPRTGEEELRLVIQVDDWDR